MNGNIPTLWPSRARTLPEAWEKAVLACWHEGVAIRTEYDKPGDPPSRDCTMIWTVEDPFAEPRIHRAFPGGLEDLEVYRQEVVDGVHDHWICPEEGKWTYTYHKRLFAYEIEGETDRPDRRRRRQAGPDRLYPPGPGHHLEPEARPADLRPALPPEGLVPDARGRHGRARPEHERPLAVARRLQGRLHERLRPDRPPARRSPAGSPRRTGRPVRVGRYADLVDSFHIYGSYFREFEGFLKMVEKRSFEERTWPSAYAEPMFEEARERLRKERKEGR